MKTIIIFLSIAFISCSNPAITTDPLPIEQSELIGTWTNNGNSFQFFDNGDFSYYNTSTLIEYNYGFWVEYETDGLLYLEDPMQFVSVWYYYSIDVSLWLSVDGVTVAEWVRE